MPNPSMSDQDLIGRRFGRLVVLSRDGKTKYNEITWICQCDCGKISVVQGKRLRSGGTKSCGCLISDVMREVATKHGKKNSRVYRVWNGMKGRCLNEKDPDFLNYGGRGVKVCDRWMKFENFYADMGDPPDRMSIDRIDVNGNYEPDNCRWATYTTQNRNRRDSVYVEWEGQTLHINEVAERLGITRGAAALRLKRGKLHAKIS